MDENAKQMWARPKTILVLLAMLLLGSIVIVSILRDRIVNYPQWQVTVTGQGKVSYTPDIANISLGVQVDKVPSAQGALQQLNTKIAKVVQAIQGAGIPAEDILTQNYSLYPQYDYKDNVTVASGYNANQ